MLIDLYCTCFFYFFFNLWKNKKSLVAFKIMPLENMNEFTTHILEIVNAHMILRKNLTVRTSRSWFHASRYWIIVYWTVGSLGKWYTSCGDGNSEIVEELQWGSNRSSGFPGETLHCSQFPLVFFGNLLLITVSLICNTKSFMPWVYSSLCNHGSSTLVIAGSIKSASVIYLCWDRWHGGLWWRWQSAGEWTHSTSESGGCKQLLQRQLLQWMLLQSDVG